MGSCSWPAVFEGGFDVDGNIEVADGPECFNNELFHAGQYPWTGQTCLHVPTGEASVRQGVNLYRPDLGTYPSEMFGRVVNTHYSATDPHIDFSYALLNNSVSTLARVDNQVAVLPLAVPVSFTAKVDENESSVPCSWPEVAA